MKKFTLALAAVCLAALALAGCSLTERQQDAAAQKTAATDPLTGLSDRWPGQRSAAVFLYNGTDAAVLVNGGVGAQTTYFECSRCRHRIRTDDVGHCDVARYRECHLLIEKRPCGRCGIGLDYTVGGRIDVSNVLGGYVDKACLSKCGACISLGESDL